MWADFCGAESWVNLVMILKKKSGVSAVIRVRENPDEADMTPPRRASMPIGGCALTLACAALMITGPASAQSASGFYLSQDIGLNLAAPVELLGNSNDRASHCDEFINPRFAEVPGCTDPARGAGAGLEDRL